MAYQWSKRHFRECFWDLHAQRHSVSLACPAIAGIKGTNWTSYVRRIYIPKRSSDKKRPLGIPTGDDKLVQEVARILLERIYEPIFSDDSHGFRSQRSCHTALRQIHKQWTGIKWFAEFDISGFFDSMNHSLLVELLEKKIDDKRFIKLIKCMLKAGYLEDFQYHPTYSGTPQGGVISPILSNIYLHELDTFVMKLQNSFTQGKKRKANPQHKRITNQMTQIRKKINPADSLFDVGFRCSQDL